jgi:hypothetical protein
MSLSVLKTIYKIFVYVFIGIPAGIFFVLIFISLITGVFGIESTPFAFIASILVIWLGAVALRAVKTNFETQREALEQNKWQSNGKKSPRLEIITKLILLVLLLPPYLIALQGIILTIPTMFNSSFLRIGVAPDDLLGQAILTVFAVAFFLPFLLVFVGLGWLIYKFASRLAHLSTYVVGIHMEHQRLEEEMITTAGSNNEQLSELPEQEHASLQR